MTPAMLHRTALHGWHVRHGAKMTPFAGYDMPVQYSSGIIAEHKSTREAVGVFDVSHMGQVALRCRLEDLARLVPAGLASLAPMQTVYSLLLNERGGVIDDLMITRLNQAGDSWFLVVNAGRKHVDLAHLKAHLPQADIAMHDDRTLLALQGPRAASIMAQLWPAAADLNFMRAGLYAAGDKGEIMVTRSGYTGEDGFEISLPDAGAETFIDKMLALGALPVGLGARDTLRLEAGLCLYGHELDETISPVEAGLGWTIPLARRTAGDFPGAERILHELAHGGARRRVGLALEGKAIARDGAEVLDAAGVKIGVISSGGFSPTLDQAIAMAFVDPRHAAPGAAVQIPLRGRMIAARIVKMPFVPHRYAR